MKHLVLTTARGCTISSIVLLGLLLDPQGYTFENLSLNIIIGATSTICTYWYTYMQKQYLCIFQEHLFSCFAVHSRLQSTSYFHWDEHLSLYFFSEMQLKPKYYSTICNRVFQSVGFTEFHMKQPKEYCNKYQSAELMGNYGSPELMLIEPPKQDSCHQTQ